MSCAVPACCGVPTCQLASQLSPPLLQVSGPGGSSLVPRLLHTAVGLLDEGGLEARTAGKRMLWELRRLLDGSGGSTSDEFRRALARIECKADKVRLAARTRGGGGAGAGTMTGWLTLTQ